MQSKVIHNAASAFAKYTFAVRIVHHEENIVFLSDLHQIREGGDIAVHAEDTIGDDQRTAEVRGVFFDRIFQGTRVIMLISDDFRAGEATSINDRSMIQAIRKN